MQPRLKKGVWIFFAIFVAVVAGQYLILNPGGISISFSPVDKHPDVAPISQPIPWHEVEADLAAALHGARADAEGFARSQMLLWTGDLERRLNEDFLERYFSYLPQQWLGLKAMGYWTSGKILNNPVNVEQRITRDIQNEFEKRVLRPEIAQLRIERIARGMVTRYIAELREDIRDIPEKYKIPRAAWNRYLLDIATIAQRSEGNREVPLSLKTIAAASTVGGAVAAARLSATLKPAMARIGARMSGNAAALGSEAAVAQLTRKSGAKAGARGGGRFLGPIIATGVIAWDAWDHHATRENELPVLRENLLEYLDELRENVLSDPAAGLFTIVDDLERSMVSS